LRERRTISLSDVNNNTISKYKMTRDIINVQSDNLSQTTAVEYDEYGIVNVLPNSVYSGHGIQYYPNNAFKYIGNFYRGMYHDYGTSYNLNGTASYRGAHRRNKQCGVGISYNSDGAFKNRGIYSNNQCLTPNLTEFDYMPRESNIVTHLRTLHI
jgi:antitoxin component YwqK of YwqJK toxin-antitoxin module